MSLDVAATAFEGRFKDVIEKRVDFRGETGFTVSGDSLREACEFLKEEQGFDMLLDICSVDHFGDEPRFEVVYEFYSMDKGVHLRLNVKVSEDDLEVPTVSDIWPTADWHEREVFDMMGIRFRHHPDLRRIIMWEGYPYYPLRKDFPLEGKPSDVPEVAFTDQAPLAGGPFVTIPTPGNTQVREPRARHVGEEPDDREFIPEP